MYLRSLEQCCEASGGNPTHSALALLYCTSADRPHSVAGVMRDRGTVPCSCVKLHGAVCHRCLWLWRPDGLPLFSFCTAVVSERARAQPTVKCELDYAPGFLWVSPAVLRRVPLEDWRVCVVSACI